MGDKKKTNNSKKQVKFKDLIDSADEELRFSKNTPSKAYEDFIKEAYSPALRQARRTQAQLELKVLEPPRDYEVREIRPKPNKYYDDPDSYFKPLPSSVSTSSATSATTTTTVANGTASSTSGSSDIPHKSPGAVRSSLSEPNVLYGNRRYYSRYSDDPDYFDYDLNHSVDLFRKNKTPYVPLHAPRTWERKLITEAAHTTGESALSSHMFTDSKKYEDPRYQNSSYLSAALRTPTYWAYRYQNLNPSTMKSSAGASALE